MKWTGAIKAVLIMIIVTILPVEIASASNQRPGGRRNGYSVSSSNVPLHEQPEYKAKAYVNERGEIGIHLNNKGEIVTKEEFAKQIERNNQWVMQRENRTLRGLENEIKIAERDGNEDARKAAVSALQDRQKEKEVLQAVQREQYSRILVSLEKERPAYKSEEVKRDVLVSK